MSIGRSHKRESGNLYKTTIYFRRSSEITKAFLRETEKTTKSDDEGNYEIYVIPGKYDFYAERQGFLADITTKITINENDEIDLGTKILYEGDADRSGIIDLNDTIEIVNSMGASKGDSTYSEKYDFGQKGYVSLDDMVSVVGNLYKTITIEEHTG